MTHAFSHGSVYPSRLSASPDGTQTSTSHCHLNELSLNPLSLNLLRQFISNTPDQAGPISTSGATPQMSPHKTALRTIYIGAVHAKDRETPPTIATHLHQKPISHRSELSKGNAPCDARGTGSSILHTRDGVHGPVAKPLDNRGRGAATRHRNVHPQPHSSRIVIRQGRVSAELSNSMGTATIRIDRI